MKILLFCHLGQIKEYAEYVSALKQVDSLQTVLLVTGQEEYRLGRQIGVFDAVKDILPEQQELDAADDEELLATEALRQLEDRIGVEFVNRDILLDRFFRGQPLLNIDSAGVPLVWSGLRARQFMHLMAKRLEQEIENFGPDFMFVETSFAPTRMAWRLAGLKGIPAGGFMSVRFWPERLYLETGIGYDWAEVRAAYKKMPELPLAGEELARVEERLQAIRREKIKPAYLQTDHAKGAPGFFKRLRGVRTFTGPGSWLGERAGTALRNPQVLPSKAFSPFAKFKRFRSGARAKRYLLGHQTPFRDIEKRKYAVYFLHVQPEITVEGMAFDYQDQVNTLRNILAALPADMHLVVKEHSPMLGYRPLDMYDQLVRMPGLIIAETQEDSHRLITHSKVVVTLTGTVALEAMLYGIPAIVLGSIYFDAFNGIHKPLNLDGLKKMLSDPDSLTGATEEDALRTLGSMLRASQPGKPSRVDVTPRPVDAESAQVMMSEIKKACRPV